MEKLVTRKNIGIILGPLLFGLIYFIPQITGLDDPPRAVLAVTLWTATWWITEPIPIPATSLLPLLLLPLVGGTDEKTAAMAYGNPIVFMYMGGFTIALAIEKWNLHKRIALTILTYIGTNSKQITLGVLIATAFLSMWISNAATALMMLPIATSLIAEVREREFLDEASLDKFAKGLLLTVAYAASIGGLATIIGSVPNAVLAGIASTMLDVKVTFARWFIFGFPVTVLLLIFLYFYITSIQFKVQNDHISSTFARDELNKLGPMSKNEKYVGLVFLLIGSLWMLSGFLPEVIAEHVSDTTVSVFGALILFLVPSTEMVEKENGKFERGKLLVWQDMKELPWGLLLLFGGGMSLAAAFEDSKLTDWFGHILSSLEVLPYVLIIIILSAAVLAMTEVMSNTATSNMLIPITIGMAAAIGVQPYGLMTAVALSASCAFMLPIATPPNAAVFSSDYLSIQTMVKAGIWLNIFSIVIIVLAVIFLQPLVLNY